jgi:hypothetical protein
MYSSQAVAERKKMRDLNSLVPSVSVQTVQTALGNHSLVNDLQFGVLQITFACSNVCFVGLESFLMAREKMVNQEKNNHFVEFNLQFWIQILQFLFKRKHCVQDFQSVPVGGVHPFQIDCDFFCVCVTEFFEVIVALLHSL